MSKSVTKGRRHSLAVNMNRGIMRFSFASVCRFRAFVTDLDTIGSVLSRADWPSGSVRDVVWAEGSLSRGYSTSAGAVHAFGDRMTVPERVTCPRPEWFAPGRAERPRRETVVARRIRPWRRVGLSGDCLEGAVEDSGPAAPALTHAQAGAHGLHTALRPLHARLRRPRQRRGRRSSVPLRG